MVRLRIGRKYGAVARTPHAQTKVRIVKADGELLVVASDLLKYVATDHLAGARYGAKVARAHGTGKVALALCREVLIGMGKCAAHTDHNAGVLFQMIGKVELGSHHDRIGTLQAAHHLFDKIGAYDLGVVIAQQQVAAPTLFQYSSCIRFRKAEWDRAPPRDRIRQNGKIIAGRSTWGDRALTIDPSDLERIAPLAGFKPSKGGEYYAIAKTIGLNVDYGLTEPKKLYVTSRTASPRLVIYVGLVMSSTYAAAIHQGA